jgi:hypothetical protein
MNGDEPADQVRSQGPGRAADMIVAGRSLYERIRCEVDFVPVLRTAVDDCGFANYREAAISLDAFLQWFSVIPAVGAEPFVMQKGDVDRILHAAILHTRFYRSLCEHYLGRFVDHDPVQGTPPSEWVKSTVAILRAHFGSDLHPQLASWVEPEKAKC